MPGCECDNGLICKFYKTLIGNELDSDYAYDFVLSSHNLNSDNMIMDMLLYKPYFRKYTTRHTDKGNKNIKIKGTYIDGLSEILVTSELKLDQIIERLRSNRVNTDFTE